MAEIQPRLGIGETCALLRSERRRRTLRAVADAEETTRRELARTLSEDDGATTDRIELSLYHSHLPKLTRAGAVGYDPDSETVTMTERGRRLVAFLDGVERTSR